MWYPRRKSIACSISTLILQWMHGSEMYTNCDLTSDHCWLHLGSVGTEYPFFSIFHRACCSTRPIWGINAQKENRKQVITTQILNIDWELLANIVHTTTHCLVQTFTPECGFYILSKVNSYCMPGCTWVSFDCTIMYIGVINMLESC